MAYFIKVYDTKGQEIEEIQLNEKIFADENINSSLMHEFIVMQLANARYNIAKTKTRGEVKASGRKLYRQKGTGNARVGDAASPIRRGGWVAFWPTGEENYYKSMPKKQRRKALFSALTVKVKDNEVLALNSYDYNEIKTKNAIKVIENLWLSGEKTLIIIPGKNEIITKSFRNIPEIKVILASYINPYDLLTYKKVVFLKDSLSKIEEIFLSK